MTSAASYPEPTYTRLRVDRNIACTDLLVGYCFNADVLLKLARLASGKAYENDLDGVENALHDMVKFMRSKYNLRLYPFSGDESVVEDLENMIVTQVLDFPRGYLGYPKERLPKVEEGEWEARVREVLFKEGLDEKDFYVAQRLTKLYR